MIYLSIKGRLGNQMFQYAFARALKERLKQDIVIDWHFVNEQNEVFPNIGFEDSLKHFQVTNYKSVDSINYRKAMNFSQYISFIRFEKRCPFKGTNEEINKFESDFLSHNKHKGLFYYSDGYYDFQLDRLPSNLFLTGYFESERYFNSIRDIIKKEFKPQHNRLNHNIDLYKQIEESESVCVSIRTGYSGDSFHNVCDMEYFIKGMDYIAKSKPNAVFFIFSNDIKRIKENISFKYPVVFEDGNDPVWEKLRLMYSCKHFIISNSTFSWWTQYLSENQEKIVVAPNRWFNSSIKSDLINNSSFKIL